ncbi:putative quinol monooxygenase [Halosegnis sp.]|uniref:putative quinol monooxygenase n=1 Tax=Halosegnis sp. TaxID=2864959 RepID=UPI0035D442E8
MLVVHAEFPVQEERREEALELVDTLVDESNEEPGVITYRAATDVQDPNVVRFFEQYEDADAFAAHAESAHFQEFEEQLPKLLAGEPRVVRFDVDSAAELDL